MVVAFFTSLSGDPIHLCMLKVKLRWIDWCFLVLSYCATILYQAFGGSSSLHSWYGCFRCSCGDYCLHGVLQDRCAHVQIFIFVMEKSFMQVLCFADIYGRAILAGNSVHHTPCAFSFRERSFGPDIRHPRVYIGLCTIWMPYFASIYTDQSFASSRYVGNKDAGVWAGLPIILCLQVIMVSTLTTRYTMDEAARATVLS